VDFMQSAEKLTAYFTSGPGAGVPEATECRELATEWTALLRSPADRDAARSLADRATGLNGTGTGAEELRTLIPMWAKTV
jgi:hypothetical protein